MLLTGYTDLSAAMDAVNEGNIFRFLTKPCEKELLVKAITTGVEQYCLITAERELLEKTLMGSIKVLTDVLSAASPETFGRSMRIARVVRHIATKFSMSSVWRFEAAAMLSSLAASPLISIYYEKPGQAPSCLLKTRHGLMLILKSQWICWRVFRGSNPSHGSSVNNSPRRYRTRSRSACVLCKGDPVWSEDAEACGCFR